METPRPAIRTMEEFSEYAGFSRPTVSHYFNNPNSVRPQTRALIEKALSESGFRPNVFAVNLNRNRSNILGVIVPSSIDVFYMALTRRIEALAEAAGYQTFVLSSEGKAELEERAIATFKGLKVAGVVIAPLGVSSHHGKLAKLGEKIPIVYVDSELDSTSTFVGTDNRQSFRLIVDYLLRSGDVPCFFGMPEVNANASDRSEAYRLAMEAQGLTPVFVDTQKSDSWEFEGFGFSETVRILEAGAFPTRTILCANDRVAFGVLGASYQAGVKVGFGDDCAFRVAGHDDQPLARYMCPPLTTVAQNYDEIGRIAVELLLDRIAYAAEKRPEPPEFKRVLLTGEIRLRQSA